ncbi:hypothetical protein XV03_07825 [Mycobacterium avium subsp. hominissuis]|nr:hypothetical protein XV03_07825 [Mycobacterium avium subsp. hominissuis]
MCSVHWPMLAPAMRSAIESSGDPTACAPALITAAIEAVWHKESRGRPRPAPVTPPPAPPKRDKPRAAARKRGKPVQLTLDFEVQPRKEGSRR